MRFGLLSPRKIICHAKNECHQWMFLFLSAWFIFDKMKMQTRLYEQCGKLTRCVVFSLAEHMGQKRLGQVSQKDAIDKQRIQQL